MDGKWLPPKDHDEHLPTFLDDVSWDEEYMEERARAVSDAKNKKKRDSANKGAGSGSEEPEGRGTGTSGRWTRCTAVLMSLLMVLGVFGIVHDASGWDASCVTCLRCDERKEPKRDSERIVLRPMFFCLWREVYPRDQHRKKQTKLESG